MSKETSLPSYCHTVWKKWQMGKEIQRSPAPSRCLLGRHLGSEISKKVLLCQLFCPLEKNWFWNNFFSIFCLKTWSESPHLYFKKVFFTFTTYCCCPALSQVFEPQPDLSQSTHQDPSKPHSWRAPLKTCLFDSYPWGHGWCNLTYGNSCHWFHKLRSKGWLFNSPQCHTLGIQFLQHSWHHSSSQAHPLGLRQALHWRILQRCSGKGHGPGQECSWSGDQIGASELTKTLKSFLAELCKKYHFTW